MLAPIEIPLAPTNYITEVYGYAGQTGLDKLVFVTMNAITGELGKYTCGGITEKTYDLTPPGSCHVVNIAGTTKSQHLATLELTWFCD